MDSTIVRQLKKIAGADAVLDTPEELMMYEYDAGVDKSRPGAVVFAQNTGAGCAGDEAGHAA